MGMPDAFLAAELLAEAIHDGLAGHRPMDDAVAEYQRRRDVLTTNGFELTLATARLAPLSARLEAFYRTAAEQPEVARQVFGALGGSIPIADVVYPDHTEAALTHGHASQVRPCDARYRFTASADHNHRAGDGQAAIISGLGGLSSGRTRRVREGDRRRRPPCHPRHSGAARRGGAIRGPPRIRTRNTVSGRSASTPNGGSASADHDLPLPKIASASIQGLA